MATTVQRFFPSSLNWDGVDPPGGDVRALATSSPGASVNAGSCDFGTSGAKTITIDPYTTLRTTTGLDSAFGWAVHITGATGMDSTATAKRVIPAGTWLFEGRLTAGIASLAAVTVGFNVYRVAAAPSTTRTLLFSDSVSAGLVETAPPTDFSRTTPAQSEIVLEEGETIQVTYTLACTGQIGGLVINFFHGDSVGSNTLLFDVPTPGVRTRFLRDFTGASTPAGAIVQKPTKLLDATIAPAGSLTTFITKGLTATITPVGVVIRRASRFFTGTITPIGTIAKTPKKFFTGAIGVVNRFLRVFED